MSYAAEENSFSVGLFSETNPPGGGFEGVRGRKWGKRSHFWVLPRALGAYAMGYESMESWRCFDKLSMTDQKNEGWSTTVAWRRRQGERLPYKLNWEK